MAALRLEESAYVAVVFGLFIGGVAVLVLGIVLLTVLGSTESPRSITGITLITAGAALLPTGAKPPPVTPIATTNEGHLVDSQHAILRGTVDPKGQLVAWQFVYGGDGTVPYPAATVPRYLSDSEVTNKVKGEDKIDVSAQVPGVEGMHFRLVAASITSGTTDIGVDTEVRLAPPA